MKRPLAYITAAWLGGDSENAEQAARYCRAVYEAGFSPVSYTHLAEVGESYHSFNVMTKELRATEAVSYTHLQP